MVMLLLAGLNVWIFHSGVYRRVATWDVASVPPRAARVAGALSLVLWICIVLSGRMIAYNWFDCDRQPQPPDRQFPDQLRARPIGGALMSLLGFFQWCEQSGIGDTIRQSSWLFPVIEAIHLLGLGVIGGAVLVVDLRLLGLGLRRQSTAELARDAQPWLIGSLLLMMTTGGLLFLSESIKLYYHDAFWFKMASLFLAIVFTFTIQRKVILAGETRMRPVWSKVVALVSILLWSGVGIGGRWIGFS